MLYTEEGLDHQGYCIRPPSEAYSILLQATLGCSHNKCTFCGAFKNKRFAIKDRAIWEKDLQFAEKHCKRQDRIFVMDGDALIMPMKHWEWLLTNIRDRLPWVERVGTFANAKGVAMKSDEDIARLKELGLTMIYYGVESGHPEVLKRMCKGATREKLIEQGQRLKKAGMTLSITVIVGLGGTELSLEHAKATGEVLSAIDPDFAGALTLMLMPDTPLYEEHQAGRFQLPEQEALLLELRTLLAHTNLSNGFFTSNHASNYLPIKARLPEEKEATLALIDKALEGSVRLRSEWMRAF